MKQDSSQLKHGDSFEHKNGDTHTFSIDIRTLFKGRGVIHGAGKTQICFSGISFVVASSRADA